MADHSDDRFIHLIYSPADNAFPPPAYRADVRFGTGEKEIIGELRCVIGDRAPWRYSWCDELAAVMPKPRRCYSLAGAKKAMDLDWHENYRRAVPAIVRMRFQRAFYATL